MVKMLIGNKDVREFDILCPKLTNDNDYQIELSDTAVDTLTTYSKLKPDILVLDSSIADMRLEEVIDKLAQNPLEQKKCNTILTLCPNYYLKLNNATKVHTILYKPLLNNELSQIIKQMAIDYKTPDLEFGEVDWLLQALNFNCMSSGYRYMKDAIIYCYYRPDKLEFLNNILILLASLYNVSVTKVRDSLNSCIRTLNSVDVLNTSHDLYKVLYNNGNRITLKDFLERIVLYLIKTKKKGQIF